MSRMFTSRPPTSFSSNTPIGSDASGDVLLQLSVKLSQGGCPFDNSTLQLFSVALHLLKQFSIFDSDRRLISQSLEELLVSWSKVVAVLTFSIEDPQDARTDL